MKGARIHSKRRAFERYGIELSNQDLKVIKSYIKGRSIDTKILNQSDARSLHKVDYKGISLFVVYNRNKKDIVTFLTKEQAEKQKGQQNDN